ncbi:hypothetical protein MAH1_19170 [Sessilibacter sp. MAH1]
MNATELNTYEFRYAVLQVAAGRFGESYHSLDSTKKYEAEKIARTQLALQKRILESKEASQVVISDLQVQQEINNIAARYANSEEFEKELEKNNLDNESLAQAVSRNLRVDAVMDLVSASVPECTETDAKLYYYMNTDKFDQPETRQARHILITENPDFPENCRDEARRRAEQIAQRLQKKPKRFSEQAMKYSECPTAMNGGELGRVKRGILFSSVENTLFALKSGQVSDVVESPMGFHVIYCEKIYPQGSVPLHDALPIIIEKLTDRDRKNHQRNWLKSLA